MSKRTPLKQWLRQCSGQAIVLLLAVLIVMVAMVFWVVDTHTAVMRRLHAQDAGDPTVLAAAKWQAAGLNLCGELNLIHAYMLADEESNADAAKALHELQQRLTIAVPLLALQAAQVTAQENGATPLPEAEDLLRDCVSLVQFPDYYEGATEDFREGVTAILRKGELYAFPVAPVFPDSDSLLGNQDFYEAILADDYCWFWFYAYSFLESYRDYHDFGQPPEVTTQLFFDLDVSTRFFSLNELRADGEMLVGEGSMVERMNQQMRTLDHPEIPPPSPIDVLEQTEEEAIAYRESKLIHPWMCYGASWREWREIRDNNFPIRSEVKPEYDVLGAYTVVSIEKHDYPWMAAAKPFGDVGGEPPREHEVVLGGFQKVRLVPVDALGAGLRPFDAQWYRHIYLHVREYARRGDTIDTCRYCKALQKWDMGIFRITASAWLAVHGHTCRRPKPGRGESGGVNYAH